MTLPAFAAAFLLGIFVADSWKVSEAALWLLAVAATLSAALFVSRKWRPLPALLLLVLILGMLRVEVPRRDRAPDLIQFHSAGTVEVRGVVSRSPEAAGTATRVRLRACKRRRDNVPPRRVKS